jgi:murein DD-endopeptidase MepM/ murein hydrolase activator NlpD
MSKDKRDYTLLIAPSSSSKIRQLRIPHRLIQVAAAFVVIFAIVIIYGLVRLAGHEALNLKYLSVKAENDQLKQANDAYASNYERLKGQLSYIEDMSKELARQAKLEHAPEVDDYIGIGGPEAVAGLDKAADSLEREVRQLNDRLRSDLLRLASVPTGLPVNGYVTDGYGTRRNPFGGEGRESHEGLDISVDFGTPVSATADGLVVFAAPYAGYGNLVILYHNNGITTRFGHLSRITVEVGQRIKRGEQIGLAGSTGRSTGPHVHYEIRENDQPVDPLRYVGTSRP